MLHRIYSTERGRATVDHLRKHEFGPGKGSPVSTPVVAYRGDIARLTTPNSDEVSQVMLMAGHGTMPKHRALRASFDSLARKGSVIPSSFVRNSPTHAHGALDVALRPPQNVSSHERGMDPRFHARPDFLRRILEIAAELWKDWQIQTVVEDNHLHLHHYPTVKSLDLVPPVPAIPALVKISPRKAYARLPGEQLMDDELSSRGYLRVLDQQYIASLPPFPFRDRGIVNKSR
jgi:hypothetical protein